VLNLWRFDQIVTINLFRDIGAVRPAVRAPIAAELRVGHAGAKFKNIEERRVMRKVDRLHEGKAVAKS
jgi:hypothetical protein